MIAVLLVMTAVLTQSACTASEQGASSETTQGNQAYVEPSLGEEDRSLTVSPESGPPGAEVHLMGAGYSPNTTVQIGAGPVDSEFEIIDTARTDAQGELHTTVMVPQSAADNRRYVFVVTQEGARWKVISNEFLVTRQAPGENQTIEVLGRLTDEGVECQSMRSEDGTLYTLAGNLEGFNVGDRVRVKGTVAEISICMQGTTISVQEIEKL